MPVQFPPAEIAVYAEAVSNYCARHAIAEAGLFLESLMAASFLGTPLRRAAPATLTPAKTRVLHASRSEMLLKLRDDILQLHGFEVVSTPSFETALQQVAHGDFDLVLIDIEGEKGVAEAEHLCSEIIHLKPGQHVAYVCNYRVAIDSDCPVSVIRAEFNPEGLVRSIREVLGRFQN